MNWNLIKDFAFLNSGISFRESFNRTLDYYLNIFRLANIC